MLRDECVVSEVQQLRTPKVYRLKTTCSDGLAIEVELHEDVIAQPRISSKVRINVSGSKEECLGNDFCAHGYVVSGTEIGGLHRVVISLGGLLVILKSPRPLEFKPMDKVYVGLTITG
ncbi:DNA-directed RNA polymerase subunit G [Desulfurococcus mucosus]|uniref:Uncharacterized protein n=1 Tax=Desulfurococcus mucosus (strain ATCC 35584 / DSM 2162 / JCM 9187 / O7/1) TaxID=765177 RepID=E8R777_DESM0|nr:DNA-directed RNA polymerase subunit G [Desulfurococcus mucosus]ADV65542.1 hypothetical protein Desmu_1246 [Desulfurococcus mucosus DSM 2162]